MSAHVDTAAYLDCRKCHRTTPARLPARAPEPGDLRTWARCPYCGEEGPIRLVERRWHDETDPGRQECNSACLTGRVSCECRCGGLCHGRGHGGCLCVGRPAWNPPRQKESVPELFAVQRCTRKEK